MKYVLLALLILSCVGQVRKTPKKSEGVDSYPPEDLEIDSKEFEEDATDEEDVDYIYASTGLVCVDNMVVDSIRTKGGWLGCYNDN